ncbi:MAG TPA: M15 family metallopeptidase [Pyrinomonadaceae bacterium]|nr:M15 family metallopeptidase [Pyrinomonadaceae bacterium]
MRRFRSYVAIFLILFATLLAVILVEVETSRGQSKSTLKSSEARPSAVARNASLQNELEWEFAGKKQRGWYLYVPLIRHLLKTQNDVDTNGFAFAVERWQKKSGLTPSGVLDKETLFSMISAWQRLRLKDGSSAQPDQLITAAPADFYDPARLDELRKIEKKTYAAYKRMAAAAVADPSLGLIRNGGGGLAPGEKFLKIVSAYRSPEYQEQLRRKSPQAGRAGLALNSPHFTGRALDFYVGGDPVETKDSNRALQIKTRVYQWLVKNAERFGFRPYFYEPWHWEYVER